MMFMNVHFNNAFREHRIIELDWSRRNLPQKLANDAFGKNTSAQQSNTGSSDDLNEMKWQ